MENKQQNLLNKLTNNTKNLIIILLLLFVMGLGAIIVFRKDSISIKNYEAIIDSLHTERDNMGRQTATIKALQFENEKAFTKIATNDSTIKWLQGVVKDFKGQVSSAVVAALGTIDFGGSGTTILPGDAVLLRDTIRLYPKYKTSWDEKWSKGEILATKDSIFRNIKIRNEMEMVIGEPKKGLKYLFKSPEFEVSIKNNNPNTETKELRSFTVKNKQKHLGLGLSTGACLSGDFKIQPYVGIGINYNIIEFK